MSPSPVSSADDAGEGIEVRSSVSRGVGRGLEPGDLKSVVVFVGGLDTVTKLGRPDIGVLWMGGRPL